MSGINDRWNLNRVGVAARATTRPARVPEYGLAWDLGTNRYMTAEQYNQMLRDFATRTAREEMDDLASTPEYQEELQRAQNYMDMGAGITEEDLPDDENESLLEDVLFEPAMTGLKIIGSKLGEGAQFIAAGPGAAMELGEPEAASYEEYREAGGILSEEDFMEFDDRTRQYLVQRMRGLQNVGQGLELPVIKQATWAFEQGYKGLQVPFIMFGNAGHKNPLLNIVDPIWFQKSEYAQAWREAQDRSLGDAIIGGLLEPYVGQERLDEWRRDSAFYDLTSFGTELGVAWVADPGVIAGKTAGAALRFRRGEMPLNTGAYNATRQALQRERITTRNPITRGVGKAFASRMRSKWDDMEEYARTHSFNEFVQQRPFQRRDINGTAAAHALWWVFREAPDIDLAKMAETSGQGALHYPDIKELTKQAVVGDPKAWEDINKLKNAAPEELQKFAPGAGTFLAAIDKTKQRLDLFQKEIDELTKIADEGSPFHQWWIHTEIDQRKRDIDTATEELKKYRGYEEWLRDLDQQGQGVEISQINAAQHRFFMDNQYGTPHKLVKWLRPVWLAKANVAEMHDVDSGVMSIRRIFQQNDHLFGYRNPEALDDALQRWITAETNIDRFNLMREIEMQHTVLAATAKLNSMSKQEIDPEVVLDIYRRVIEEQDKVKAGILRGEGTVYQTGPSLGERITNPEDPGVSLVSRDAETGMVRLELMDGGRRVTVDVHESALAPKGDSAIDPTQTVNYYQPLDARRFWIELKRNQTIIENLSIPGVRQVGAGLADFADLIGTKFNALWKPMVLFRFGWPLRVLMDEQMRAMSVLGIGAFTKYYGQDALAALNNAAVRTTKAAHNRFQALLKDPVTAYRTGRDELPIGPGPMADAQRWESPDPIMRDAVKNEAPIVPEVYAPVLNNSRYGRIAAAVGEWDDWVQFETKRQAWEAESQRFHLDDPEGKSGFARFFKDVNENEAQGAPYNPALMRRGKVYDMGSRLAYSNPRPMPAHPMHTIRTRFVNDVWRGNVTTGQTASKGIRVYDPISAKQVKTGYVVPIPHTKTRFVDGDMSTGVRSNEDWYSKNAELLGSSGHRVMITPDGEMFVARVFSSNRQREARELAEFMETDMYDLRRPGAEQKFVIKPVNDLTPTVEEAYRKFVYARPVEEQTGDAPFAGSGPRTVYHGASTELPEQLLPREEVPIASGRMVGDGFYTTISREIAEEYARWAEDGDIYIIKGSRDGKRYRVFSMDREITERDIQDLRRWMRENADESLLDEIEHYIDMAADGELYNPFYASGENTWLSLMANLSIRGTEYTRPLTRYLIDKHRAGVLKHRGGRGAGMGRTHDVYVWLEPENLIVKPLYDKSDRYYQVLDWLNNPASREVPIPESRIIRTGVRNPMFRELHTNHRQLMRREEELKAGTRGPGGLARAKASDPEYQQMLQRERELMDALGLRYAVDHPDIEPNVTLGQDWYVMTEPGKFEQMVAEAKAEDVARQESAAAAGELRAQELAVQEIDPNFEDFDFDIDNLHDATLRKVFRRRETGRGYVSMKSADGKEVYYKSAYEGHEGELFHSLVSSQGTMEVLSDGHGAATALFRRHAAGHRTYNPPKLDEKARTKGTRENMEAIEYFHVWADMLNSQVAHSPIWDKMLKGWSDERIVGWLEKSHEGRQAMREIKHEAQDVELWVNNHRALLDYYLPSPRLRRKLREGRIKPSDLRKEIREDQYPDVFGPDVEFLDKRSVPGRLLGWMADRVWHALGTVPIDTFSRHPFARAAYDLKMRSLIASTDSEWLTPETLARYEKMAHAYARDQVRKTLWDLTDQTNFADMARFMFPFWNAQSEALVKWARIVMNRPETVFRFYNLQRAARNNFIMVNEDGERVERSYFDYKPGDRVILKIPEGMRKGPLGKALMTVGEVGIPLGSANTILQGENPLLPGPGIPLTVPADKFLRAVSDTYGVEYDENFLYRWLFPIGRPQHGGVTGVLDQLLPGWAKRLVQLGEGDGGTAYANLFTDVWREMEHQNREKGLPPPTPEQVKKQADWLWGLRIVAGLFSPVQLQFRPKHQFWIDQAHKFSKEEGIDWFDKFVEQYGPEAARYATSSSNSTVGIPPTSLGMEEWAENKALIQKYKHWGDAIISPDAYTDDFSSDAYYAQFQINVGPGDDTPLRETQSASERLARTDARLGWMEYRQMDAIIDSQLQERGLTSIQQTGAEDLRLMKQRFIEDLTKRLPAWREEYDSFNNDIYSRVNELNQWAWLPQFDNRPDIQGVRQYLMIRNQVAAELDRYYVESGFQGSRSLQADENAALREWFYQQVGAIVQANPAFAEFYARYLSQDTLTQGSGGFDVDVR